MKMRGIKPEFWVDEGVMECGPWARLLFVGLWMMACDNGHVANKPRKINMSLFPADTVEVEPLIEELASQRLIRLVGGWIVIDGLRKHQRHPGRWFKTCDFDGCDVPPPPSGGPTDTANPASGGSADAPDSASDGGQQPPPPVITSQSDASDSASDGGQRPPSLAAERRGDERRGEERKGDLAIARSTSSEPKPNRDDTPAPIVVELCELLAERARANGHRATPNRSWYRACRLMLEADRIPSADIRGAILWATQDDFWLANIRSMPTLREKYSTLRAQAQRPQRRTRQQETDDWYARTMERAERLDAAGAPNIFDAFAAGMSHDQLAIEGEVVP